MTTNEQNVVASGLWTISDNGQQLGPYALDQMKQMVGEGRVSPGALVWTPGMTEWRPWRQTPEFALLGGVGGWSGPMLPASRGQIVDYLVFRRMVLPIVMQVVFWLGLLVLVALDLHLFRMLWAISEGFEALMAFLLCGVGFLVVAFFWRCVCEALILFYRINETLTDVKDAIEKQGK